MNTEIHAQYVPWNAGVGVWLINTKHDGSRALATNVEFGRELKEYETLSSPLFEISSHGAQRLMQELWDCGIRPNGVGTSGHLAASNDHLQDMRRLVDFYTDGGLNGGLK